MPEKQTRKQLGWAEPGFETFARFYMEGGTRKETIEQYADKIGTIRNLSPKPLLKLTPEELKTLDMSKVRNLAGIYRTVLRMFYTGNERDDLLKALRFIRHQKKRRIAFEEILFPEEVQAIVVAAGTLRDRALVATLYASGGRIDEILTLRIRNIVRSNGGYQVFIGKKIRGQERYSPKIQGVWKEYLDALLAAHPARDNPDAWVFLSTEEGGNSVGETTVNALLHKLGKKAGVTKRTNAHWFRHSRISIAFAQREADMATICQWFWGVPVTSMANRYSHFQGLEMSIEEPKPLELPPVPVMPVPLIARTAKQVSELTAKVERIEERDAALQKVVLDAMRSGNVTPEIARLAEILLQTK